MNGLNSSDWFNLFIFSVCNKHAHRKIIQQFKDAQQRGSHEKTYQTASDCNKSDEIIRWRNFGGENLIIFEVHYHSGKLYAKNRNEIESMSMELCMKWDYSRNTLYHWKAMKCHELN